MKRKDGLVEDENGYSGTSDPIYRNIGRGSLRFLPEKGSETECRAALTGFAAGVMVAASIWSLIVPSIEQSEDMGKWAFLPAFIGAKPYHQAWERGVKIIGATSHYVTAELDAGPIIEQDVTRITHKDTPESLVLKGKDLEKIVLSHAVQKHIERKILTYKNKTIIFS